MKRKTDRDYMIETKEMIKDFIDMQKDQPIRKDNKEKTEYIRNELNTLAESDNYLDQVRYKILLKMV